MAVNCNQEFIYLVGKLCLAHWITTLGIKTRESMTGGLTYSRKADARSLLTIFLFKLKKYPLYAAAADAW